MKNSKSNFKVILSLTLKVACSFLQQGHASSFLKEIDLRETSQPLDDVLKKLSIEFTESAEWQDLLKNARHDTKVLHSIGIAYERKGGKCRETLMDVYKHAVIHGSTRAWYSLGQHYYAKNERGKAGNCFLGLSKRNADLFLRLDDKYGKEEDTYSFACKLWREDNPLSVRLFEKLYETCPKRRKKIVHYLAKGYAIGGGGFPHDVERAKYWLQISAQSGNLEDDYVFCAQNYREPGKNQESLQELVGRVRPLVEVPIMQAKYGAKPKIFLTRLLVECASTQQENRYLQEAFHWLLRALGETGKTGRPLIWAMKDGIVRDFAEMEKYRQSSIDTASDSSTKYINLYEVAFTYLEASGQEKVYLKKAGESFLQSYDLFPNLSCQFYATLIRYYLTLYNPAQSVISRGIFHMMEPLSSKDVRLQPLGIEDICRSSLGTAEDINRLGGLYLRGRIADNLSNNAVIAERLFKEAASKGCEEAMLNLASGYMNGWFGKVDVTQAKVLYEKASSLSDELKYYQDLVRDGLVKGDATLIRKLISDFPGSKFKGHASLLALFYRRGLFAISQSTEHGIFFLKVAAQGGDEIAARILTKRYPLAISLNSDQRKQLVQSRTYTDGRPNIAIIGGGISGVLTAIQLEKLSREGKISAGEICLIEQNSLLLKGASELASRLHLGGEYPKDPITASQCLFGAILFRQMFQTERVLTPIAFNDFLLSFESLKSSEKDSQLSETELLHHYELLNQTYAGYLDYLNRKDSSQDSAKLLFGDLPLFHKIRREDLEKLGVSHHFALGLRTKERGLQAIGLGVVLEHLLDFYKVNVHYNCRVDDITVLSDGGLALKSDNHSPIYAQYLINAAWDNNAYLEWLIKRQIISNSVQLDVPRPIKHVFLRSLALIDMTGVSMPSNSSFFGLVGRTGGMVSCFNKSFATLFIPQEGLSYQGQYDLSPAGNYPHTLPSQGVDKRASLESDLEQVTLCDKIRTYAQTKYPFLKDATVLGVITHTTLSDDNELFKRKHSNAYWVGNALQLCAQKLTFAPFVASQAVARFIFDSPADFRPHFNAVEREYLSQFRAGEVVADPKGTLWNACLPDCFTLIKDESFMGHDEFWNKMHMYAFHRRLPFTIFDESDSAKKAGRDFPKQFNLIAQNTNLREVDLGFHSVPVLIVESLINFLKDSKVLTTVRLGRLSELNDDDEDEKGAGILAALSEIPTLQAVTLKGWNLSFSKRYKPLKTLVARLQSICFEDDVTLTARAIKHVFMEDLPAPVLTHFTFRKGTLNAEALEALLASAAKLSSLRYLNLWWNNMGSSDLKSLTTLLSSLPFLEKVDLGRNQLFTSLQLDSNSPHDLPLPLEANPLLFSITTHPALREVDLNDNGPASSILQDRIDYWMALRRNHNAPISRIKL